MQASLLPLSPPLARTINFDWGLTSQMFIVCLILYNEVYYISKFMWLMWQDLKKWNKTNKHFYFNEFFCLQFGVHKFLSSTPRITLLETTITKKAEINFHSLWTTKRRDDLIGHFMYHRWHLAAFLCMSCLTEWGFLAWGSVISKKGLWNWLTSILKIGS